MLCQNCGETINTDKPYFSAGKNNTIFCNRDCCYKGFEGFYSRKEVDQTMKEYTHVKENEEMSMKEMDQRLYNELTHEMDDSLGSVLCNVETLKAIDTEVGQISVDVENTDPTDMTALALQMRDIKHKILLIADLLHYTVNDFETNYEKAQTVKTSLFDFVAEEE